MDIEEPVPEWVLETIEDHTRIPCCPICGAEIIDHYYGDCGCFADIHYGKD